MKSAYINQFRGPKHIRVQKLIYNNWSVIKRKSLALESLKVDVYIY
jgi:hypothetical protein